MVGILDSLGIGDSGNSGDSSLTPESIAMRRKLAEAMLAQGQSDTPIVAPTQGINRVLQSIIGNYRMSQLDQADRAGSKEANSQIARIFGGGAATPASPIGAPAAVPAPAPAPPPVIASPAQGAGAAAGRSMPAPGPGPMDPAAFIKQQEGYAPVAKWDVRQNSGGYGSKAEPGETFTPEKADQYLQRDMQPSLAWIDKNVPNATPAQRTALASFGYNLGTDDLDKLLPDIQRGDWATVGRRMLSFNNTATGPNGALEPSNALKARRLREAALLQGGGSAPAAAPAQPAAPVAADALVPPSAASQLQRQAIELMKNPRNAALGKELLIKAAMAEAPKQPEAVQEYALAVKQGYSKPFMDYQIEMKQASRPQNIVSVSGDKKGAEEMAKLHAQEYDKIRSGANAARTNMANLDTLEEALNAGVNTGALGESEQSLRKLAQYFGVGNVNKVAAGDLAQAISNRLALAVRSPNSEGGGMPGAMSDPDREFLKSSVPGLTKTPEGNRQLIDIARKLGQRSIDTHKMAVRYAQAHDGQLDPGFEAQLDAWADANPLFPANPDAPRRVQTQTINPATGQATAGAAVQAFDPSTGAPIGGPPSGPKVSSAQEARDLIRTGKLKSGDHFIDENGIDRVVH